MIDGAGLLERAISYALGSLHLVTPDAMTHRTPCQAWNLRDLLAHMEDSLAALHDAADIGRVDLDGPGPHTAGVDDPAAAVRNGASRLLGAYTNATGPGVVSVAGSPLAAGIVTGTGAIELTVHGWDVAMACGRRRAIPAELAEHMLGLAPLFVTDRDRPARFAEPVPVPAQASPGDRLIAFLGRRP